MMVSVIIPTYKPGDYIYECLKAVCNQSFSKDDYEIVIVVNGCKEPFVENISSYLKKTLELSDSSNRYSRSFKCQKFWNGKSHW